MRELKILVPSVLTSSHKIGFSPDYEGIEVQTKATLKKKKYPFSPDYEGIEVI